MEVRRIIDSRIDTRAPKVLLARQGPSRVSYQVQPAQGTANTTNPSFVVEAPSTGSGIGRYATIHAAGRLTITGTALDAFQGAPRIALRRFAYQSCCSNLQCFVNDAAISMGSLSQFVAALQCVGQTTKSAAGLESGTAAAPDVVSTYEDAVGLFSPFDVAVAGGPNSYAASSRTNGITAITPDVNNPTTVLHVDFDIREPLLVPPFSYTDDGADKAIFGVNKVIVQASLGNFHRMLSLAIPGSPTAVSSITCTFNTQELETTFVVPRDRSLLSSDHSYFYQYGQLNTFETLLTGTLTAGATVVGNSQTVNMSVIPYRLLVFATYSDTDRSNATISLPDTFLPIQNLNVSFGTNTGLFGAATQHQIWQRSYKNGVSVPYYVASGAEMLTSVGGTAPRGAGAPVVIDVAADLALPDGICPGMAVRTNIQVQTAVFNNQKRTLTNPQLWIVAITDAFIENKDGSTIVSQGGIPGTNIDEFPAASIEYSDEFESMLPEAGYGGKKGRGWRNFMSGLKAVGNVAKTGLQMAAPMLEAVNPELGIAAKLLGARRR